jgi:hypothetical protein
MPFRADGAFVPWPAASGSSQAKDAPAAECTLSSDSDVRCSTRDTGYAIAKAYALIINTAFRSLGAANKKTSGESREHSRRE